MCATLLLVARQFCDFTGKMFICTDGGHFGRTWPIYFKDSSYVPTKDASCKSMCANFVFAKTICSAFIAKRNISVAQWLPS